MSARERAPHVEAGQGDFQLLVARPFQGRVRVAREAPRYKDLESATAFVNSVEALSKSNVPFVPSTLVMGANGGGALDGLMALMMRQMGGNLTIKPPAA